MVQLVACPHHPSWPLPSFSPPFSLKSSHSVTIHIMNKYGWCCITSIHIDAFYPFPGKHYPLPLLVYLCYTHTKTHKSGLVCTSFFDMPFACGIHLTWWWQPIGGGLASTVHAAAHFAYSFWIAPVFFPFITHESNYSIHGLWILFLFLPAWGETELFLAILVAIGPWPPSSSS